MALTPDDIKMLKDALQPEFNKMKNDIKQELGSDGVPTPEVGAPVIPPPPPMPEMPTIPPMPETPQDVPVMPPMVDNAVPSGIAPQAVQAPDPVQPPAMPDLSAMASSGGLSDMADIATDDAPAGDAGSLLAKFADSNFGGMKQVVKFVKDGHKLDNAAMQELLYRLKTKHTMTYRELLSIYLTMDMAVEKGVLTNDIIDYLKKNPDMIQKF